MSAHAIVYRRFKLATISRIGIGGFARRYARAASVPGLIAAVTAAAHEKNPPMIIGGATNILFPDADITTPVIHNQASGIIPLDGRTLWIASGTDMSDVVAYCLKNSRTGFSWAAGLPGTIGGAVYGNAGAFGGQMDQCVQGVVSLERKGGGLALRYRDISGCAFAYRTSAFKRLAHKGAATVIVAVIVRAPRTRAMADEKERAAHHRRYRMEHHPMLARTLGSTFQNVPVEKIPLPVRAQLADRIKRDPFPVIPAAVLLDRAGCKNLHVGGASFSAQHANFIVASGQTSAGDVKKLCHQAHARVRREFGVALAPEIIMHEKKFSSAMRRRKSAQRRK